MSLTPSPLLDRAYLLVEKHDFREAKRVLEVVVNRSPHNIEAWEFYFQLCDDREELDRLANRVDNSKIVSPANKRHILDYYDFLTRSREAESRRRARRIRLSVRKQFGKALRYLLPLVVVAFFIFSFTFNQSLFAIFILLELGLLIGVWRQPKNPSKSSLFRTFASDFRLLPELEEDDFEVGE